MLGKISGSLIMMHVWLKQVYYLWCRHVELILTNMQISTCAALAAGHTYDYKPKMTG
jgi:hypothetical protein